MSEALTQFVERSAAADRPALTQIDGMPNLGGVDPLGLRQLNFELMDAVLPGLNNVGQRIRPFVVVAWAARQATRLAEKSAPALASDTLLRDFVDRIEVLYAWSQFLRGAGAELPGARVLKGFINAERYVFAGKAWETFKADRARSTAFTAAITYGPSIKALGWAGPIAAGRRAWAASELFEPALDAFESTFAEELQHPAFSTLGKVEVDCVDVARWVELWDMDEVTPEEQSAFSESLCGVRANEHRRSTLALLKSVVQSDPDAEFDVIRAAMAKASPEAPASVAWRRLQVRQAFRYALESWFYWCLTQLDPSPKSTSQLVDIFRSNAKGWATSETPGSWLTPPIEWCPVTMVGEIRAGLVDRRALPEAICRTLALCLSEIDPGERRSGRADRLPLWRARDEASAWQSATPAAFLTHMMETWLFAQHAYWSSSRSLADARAGGKVILRLRVTLDEGGWRLTPLGGIGSEPYPTPDRLETAYWLGEECGFL